jgi:type VI secretion system secreted protein Hcp
MAFDAFIKLTEINGPVTRKGLEKFIEVMSFSHGVSQSINMENAGGMAGGKPVLSSISFMKRGDATSPLLFSAICGGKHFAEVVIWFFKSGGTNQVKFMEYKLTKVFIDSFQVSGSSGGDDTPMESLSLAFQKIEISYLPQDEKGGVGKPVIAFYDVANATSK